eukprot:gb/GEZN01007862.1/.p1 GENE.gb/GEZN01007862.1/~~gb/GEZN01007862.1/.p1  ORF type:complete len:392 (+),score=52.75 gb/GEZN01007862.1/:86-1261(+)
MPRILEDVKVAFKDVLIRPKRSTINSRSEVSLDTTYEFLYSKRKWEGVPIIAANMDTVGTFEMAIALTKSKVVTAIHKHYTVEEWAAFGKANPNCLPYICVSSGIGEKDFKKTEEILKKCPDINFICLDVANGYSEGFVSCVRKARKTWPDHTIMAGNVVTGEMVEELILSGADIVKVGIGPGSVCTTRIKTGVGYPQLSAIIECADAAHGLKAHIIGDGGCTNPGDIAKAFGGGADFVMLGGMLSGHDESAGEMVEVDGRKFKEFYGMSSQAAMAKHHGGVAEYRASEGKHVLVPYRGPVENMIKDILGGIRSTCAYVGAEKLKHLSKCTTFIRVTMQVNQEFSGLETRPLTTDYSQNKETSSKSTSSIAPSSLGAHAKSSDRPVKRQKT